jgi:hypothetical protein
MGWRDEIAKALIGLGTRGRTPYGQTTPKAFGEAGIPDRGGVAGPIGRDEGLLEARAQAERRAAGRLPLSGLPLGAQEVEGKLYIPGPIGKVHDVADQYMRGRDFGVLAPDKFHPLDKAHAQAVAQAYDALPMFDPRALPSYDAMARETMAQYQAMKNAGLRLTPADVATYPYHGNPRAVVKDIADNNHMAFFKSTEGFGSGNDAAHPLLTQSGEYAGNYPMLNNDLFRVVHDYFGHAKNGYGFRAAGEDNAWRAHAAMYSPEARPAMTTETRGQNSWLNYGPHGDFNRTANAVDTIYAPQKVALMPDWTMGDLLKRYGLAGAIPTMGALAAQDRYEAPQ